MNRELTVGELIREIETSYYDDLTSLCTNALGSFMKKETDMTIYATGLPISLFNGILDPCFNSRNISERIELAMSYFQKGRIPMSWVLGPSSTPPELEEILLKMDMVLELIYSGMAIDLTRLKRKSLPAGLTIQTVRDERSLGNFIDITAEVFEFPEHTRDGWGKIIKNVFQQPNICLYLGILRGKPVSTSLLSLHQEVASLYTVATLNEARGMGIGSAITCEPLLSAKSDGYKVAVLEATDMGRPIYERLGFKKYCEFRYVTWNP